MLQFAIPLATLDFTITMPRVTRSKKDEWESLPSPLKQLKSPAPKRRSKKKKTGGKSPASPGSPRGHAPSPGAKRNTSKGTRKNKKSPRSPRQPPKSVSFEQSEESAITRTLNRLWDWMDENKKGRQHSRSKGKKRRVEWSSDSASTTSDSDASSRSDSSEDRQYRKARRRERFDMGQATGKPTKLKKSKIHRDDRPYMYLERDILDKVKKRDSYDCLTKDEYFTGMAAMILEKSDPTDKAYHLIEHMAMVAEDALEHSWDGVRKWSNTIFDRVEKHRITWADKQEIKELRYALSWIKSSKIVKDQVPCDSFNMDGKEYDLPDEHTDDKYTYRHRCAACWYGLLMYDCNHPSHLCKRKKGMWHKYNDAQTYKEEQRQKYKEGHGQGQVYHRKYKPDYDQSKN